LTKTMQAGTPGVRKAEMPVRAPQYDMQSRVMEQEYGYKQPNVGLESMPGSNWMSSGPTQHHSSSPVLVQPQPQQPNDYYFPTKSMSPAPQLQQQMLSTPGRSGSPQLPPGAMPPVAGDQAQVWNSPPPIVHRAALASPPQTHSTAYSKAPRPPRSPPPQNRHTPENPVQGNSTKLSGRSLSVNAAAVPQPQVNGGKLRKGSSARAVATSKAYQPSNEEDVPLALWQQQHRR
jgi:hypothetical protein